MDVLRITRRQLLAALAAVAAAPAGAAEPPPAGSGRYLIELIVFRQPGTPPAAARAPAIAPTATLPGRVIALPQADWQLLALDAELARTGFAPIAHTAWVAIVPQNGRTTAHLEDVLPAGSPLAGQVALQRGQYLYLGVDLDFRPPDAGGTPAAVYSLREKRRIKFGERHYFDHPALGVIATVNPSRGISAEG
jgi:hypothetical protein